MRSTPASRNPFDSAATTLPDGPRDIRWLKIATLRGIAGAAALRSSSIVARKIVATTIVPGLLGESSALQRSCGVGDDIADRERSVKSSDGHSRYRHQTPCLGLARNLISRQFRLSRGENVNRCFQ